MAEQLIFTKAVDMSVLKEGLSIPVAVQEELYTGIKHVVRPGESFPISLVINNLSYKATLKNQAYDRNKYPERVDVVQIRYPTNSDVAEKIRSIFSVTEDIVERFLNDRQDVHSQLIIPEDQREYIAVYASTPRTIRLDCIPRVDAATTSTGIFKTSFKIGDTVTNEQLYREFACGNMGGMRRSTAKNCLVIISDHTKSFYDDKWYGDELHYTGMGKNGDQRLTSQNKTLAGSQTNGVAVHLFEVLEAGKYIYNGPVELCGEPYQEDQPDESGRARKVLMFPIRALQEKPITKKSLDAYIASQQKKAASLTAIELKKKAEENGAKVGSNRSVTSTVYVRDEYVAEYTKLCAAGVCELCGRPAPFNDKSGKPYLESHHIVWLANGGEDTIRNTVALCPNCHRKMHIVNDSVDQSKLLANARKH